MRITQNKNNKYKIALWALGGVLVLIGVVVVLHKANVITFGQNEDKPENTINYDKPTDEQVKESERIKEEFDKKHYGDDNASPSLSKDGIGVIITSVSQEEGILSVRVMVQSTNIGECGIEISNNNTSYTAQAQTMIQGSYGICKGFDVPVSQLSPGSNTIKILYNEGDQTGSTEKTVEVK